MSQRFRLIVLLGIYLSVVASCKKEDLIKQLQNIDISQTENGIVPVPNGFHKKINEVFTKYTKITADNGRPIHFFAQSGVDDEKIILARSILEMYLRPVPNSKYGTSKFFIGNSMADRNAALFMFNTQAEYESKRGQLGFVPFAWQDLYASETFVEGSSEYLVTNPRNAAFEEILHLTQDRGISLMMPLYQKEIDDATEAAVGGNVYKPDSDLPKADYDQEYFATIWDVYRGDHAHAASSLEEYSHHTPNSLQTNDPAGYALIEAFLPRYLTYEARIDSKFDGIFHLDLVNGLAYTLKSQYLLYATLTGDFNSGLVGNAQVNILRGNRGNNSLKGQKNNDLLDGQAGIDTAIYTGNFSQYTIATTSNQTLITDNTADRDGIDTLRNIEYLRFADQVQKLGN